MPDENEKLEEMNKSKKPNNDTDQIIKRPIQPPPKPINKEDD